MQCKPIEDLADKADQVDFMVLDTIIDESSGLWSVSEVGKMLGAPLDVEDSINRLLGLGLVHRLGEFVFPTRAAIRSHLLPR